MLCGHILSTQPSDLGKLKPSFRSFMGRMFLYVCLRVVALAMSNNAVGIGVGPLVSLMDQQVRVLYRGGGGGPGISPPPPPPRIPMVSVLLSLINRYIV